MRLNIKKKVLVCMWLSHVLGMWASDVTVILPCVCHMVGCEFMPTVNTYSYCAVHMDTEIVLSIYRQFPVHIHVMIRPQFPLSFSDSFPTTVPLPMNQTATSLLTKHDITMTHFAYWCGWTMISSLTKYPLGHDIMTHLLYYLRTTVVTL